MGKKLKIQPLNTTKAACESLSSNCIIWQGPNIPCLDICKGASITEVMYGIAVQFCQFYEELNPDNYDDLDCLTLDNTCDATFKDIIQALITQVCALKAGGCNIIVTIEKDQPTIFTANVDTNATSVASYEWSVALFTAADYTITGETTPQVELNLSGGGYTAVLSVIVTDSNGCKANASYLVNQD